ncbi:unnamed protein product [Acanthoscelides obtectus]|uniref:Uncharacterized protein n=1 Tax=Acanthoscelides obtectus TaxID=200917 RepID=A0A9P0LJQ0_ACAOB|nr:unnamed protein product [Acanthoscelides obtectus]CAK1655728.1 hypothetical protein AOBTE_LOCUS19285 [Acanthoscelides obtectus]
MDNSSDASLVGSRNAPFLSDVASKGTRSPPRQKVDVVERRKRVLEGETAETPQLTTTELQRLVLLQQLAAARLQQDKDKLVIELLKQRLVQNGNVEATVPNENILTELGTYLLFDK